MMRIGSAGGTNNMQAGRPGMNMGADSVSKNIQNQISIAQKKLQDLSSNEDMTMEEKMKKRQAIQQEIAGLNQQLRQHQAEKRKSQQQSKSSSFDDLLGGRRNQAANSAGQGAGMSQTSMKAMISADTSMKQARAQEGVTVQIEGKADVLEGEIKLDKSRGGNGVAKKEEELAQLEQKAQASQESQMSILADANKAIEESAKEEKPDKVKDKNKETDSLQEGKDLKTESRGQEEAGVSIDIRL